MSDSEQVTRYPLYWPSGRPRTPADRRRRAAFKNSRGVNLGTSRLTVHQAIYRVIAEIRLWTRSGQAWRSHPDDVIFSSNLRTKADGLPYSDQPEPKDPGVAVYFELDKKPHCLSCDRWDRVADNIAAIAKHLEATRGMQRWGVADLATLFAGFAALPAHVPPEPWRSVLDIKPGAYFSLADAEAAYAKLAKIHHPDRGGSVEAMQRLNEAIERARKELR